MAPQRKQRTGDMVRALVPFVRPMPVPSIELQPPDEPKAVPSIAPVPEERAAKPVEAVAAAPPAEPVEVAPTKQPKRPKQLVASAPALAPVPVSDQAESGAPDSLQAEQFDSAPAALTAVGDVTSTPKPVDAAANEEHAAPVASDPDPAPAAAQPEPSGARRPRSLACDASRRARADALGDGGAPAPERASLAYRPLHRQVNRHPASVPGSLRSFARCRDGESRCSRGRRRRSSPRRPGWPRRSDTPRSG